MKRKLSAKELNTLRRGQSRATNKHTIGGSERKLRGPAPVSLAPIGGAKKEPTDGR